MLHSLGTTSDVLRSVLFPPATVSFSLFSMLLQCLIDVRGLGHRIVKVLFMPGCFCFVAPHRNELNTKHAPSGDILLSSMFAIALIKMLNCPS